MKPLAFCIVVFTIMFFGNASVFSQTAAPSSTKDEEWPLLNPPEYDGCQNQVSFPLIINEYGGTCAMWVVYDQISVKVRDDGKNHTSALFKGVCGHQSEQAVILVPLKEDLATWVKEVDHWKALRKKYLERFPKPRRILPSQSQNE